MLHKFFPIFCGQNKYPGTRLNTAMYVNVWSSLSHSYTSTACALAESNIIKPYICLRASLRWWRPCVCVPVQLRPVKTSVINKTAAGKRSTLVYYWCYYLRTTKRGSDYRIKHYRVFRKQTSVALHYYVRHTHSSNIVKPLPSSCEPTT